MKYRMQVEARVEVGCTYAVEIEADSEDEAVSRIECGEDGVELESKIMDSTGHGLGLSGAEDGSVTWHTMDCYPVAQDVQRADR